MKKTALFTTAAVVAMAGVATAGTLKTGSAGTAIKPISVAKEAVDGGTTASPLQADLTTLIAGTFTPGDPAATPPTADSVEGGLVVTPTTIPLSTLSNGVMNFTASAGKFTVTATDLSICDMGANGTPVQELSYKTGSGSNSIVFDVSNGGAGNISNGRNYFLAYGAACSPTPADPTTKVELSVPAGTASTSLTVQTGIATTQTIYDTATASIIAVGNQLSASVTKPAGIQIDFDKNFTQLIDTTTTPSTSGITSDTLGVAVTAAVKDVPATFSAGDKVITTITVSDPAGLKTTGTATGADVTGIVNPGDVSTGVFGDTTCADVTTAGKIVCTSTASAPLVDPATLPMAAPVTDKLLYTINVDGTTAITEKTFNVTTEYDFSDTTMQDRTVANSNPLLNNAPAGAWTFRGTTIYVPLIKEGNGANTFIKLQSKADAAVRGLVLCSDGISRAVDLGTIKAGTPKTITSTDIVTALGATGSVDAASGYAMTLSVTSDKANVFGYANTVDGAGNAKRIPLSTVSGVEN